MTISVEAENSFYKLQYPVVINTRNSRELPQLDKEHLQKTYS